MFTAQRTRCLLTTFVLAALALPTLGDLDTALKSVPADAVGFVCVPNLEQTDRHYQQLIRTLGLRDMMPEGPARESLRALIKQGLGVDAGLDQDGALTLVMMPSESLQELTDRQVLILPATEPRKLLDELKAQPGANDLWDLDINDEPMVAKVVGKSVVLSGSEDAVAAFKLPSESDSLYGKLSDSEKRALANLDIAIWLDAAKLVELSRSQIEPMLMMFKQMQAAQGGELGQMQGAQFEIQMRRLMDGASRLVIGFGAGDPGLQIRFALGVKEGSELAKTIVLPNSTMKPFVGLPAGDYVMAYTGANDPQRSREALKDGLSVYIEMLKGLDGVDKDQVDKLYADLSEMVGMLQSTSMSVNLLGGGKDGLLAMYSVAQVSDAEKYLDTMRKMVDEAKQVTTDEDIAKWLKPISLTPSDETVGGAKIWTLAYDVKQLGEIDFDDEMREMVAKLLGETGVSMRLGAVENKWVFSAIGGGNAGIEKMVALLKEGAAPLATSKGIAAAHKQFPDKPVMEMYFSVDAIVRTVRDVSVAMDEDPLPIQMGNLDAPLAMSTTNAENWSQVDVFVPTDLMVAIRKATMQMMGMPADGGSPQ